MRALSTIRIAAASAILFCGTAGAVTFTAVGDNATINWSGTYAGAALSASATFTLTSFNGTQAVFGVSIANNTLAGQPGTNRLVSIAIDDISPNLTGASISNEGSGGDTWTAVRDVTFPGGFHQVELCIWAGTNCSGGDSSGLVEGESDSFILTLTGNFGSNISLLAPFPSKWQSVGMNGRSFEFGGCVVGTCGGSVPEPGPLALFGLGLTALALRRRPRAN